MTVLNEFNKLKRELLEAEFSKLNRPQKEAVFNSEGAMLILAGAGSGKTTGSSNVGNNSLEASGSSGKSNTSASGTESGTYILNTKTMKFHRPDCDSVKSIKAENREEYTGEREKLINEGYEACKSCKP